MESVKLNLSPDFFSFEGNKLIESDNFSAVLFKYKSSVCGLRLINSAGNIELLPFQGQQIWKAHFDGRDLQMKTLFEEPVQTTDLLKNFGCFMAHCGALRVGAPSSGESHQLHGELPNALYQKAWVVYGEDKKGHFISLSGKYEHRELFGAYYEAEPEVRLYENSSEIEISMKIKNLSYKQMELMYLCHINFLPVDGSRIEYSAEYSPDSVKIRSSVPSHIKPDPGYIKLIDELKINPILHHQVNKRLKADPELVFYINYSADDSGKCYTLQIHPDGKSDYVCHQKSQLPKAMRWISRTGDHDAIAIVEPATCEVDGYHTEKEKGNILILNPGEEFACNIKAGTLNASGTNQVLKRIERIKKLL
jgi:hypothetical protein